MQPGVPSSAAEEGRLDDPFSAARRFGPRAEARGGPRFPPALVLLVSVLAISWAAPLIRLTGAPALAISFWRLALSTGISALIVSARGEWLAVRSLSIAEWVTAGLAGVFLAGHFAAWIASVGLTSVAASVALVSTQPVWVALLAGAAFGERPSPRQWLGILAAVAGAAWIAWGDAAGAGGGHDPLRGDLLALVGALLVAGYYVIGRGLRPRIDLWPYVAVVYGIATVTLLAAALATGTPLVRTYGAGDWLVFVGLALGPMLIGHTGQNWALRYLPAHVVNVSLLGEPVGATLIAWALPGLSEVPPRAAVVGGSMILAGIALGARRPEG